VLAKIRGGRRHRRNEGGTCLDELAANGLCAATNAVEGATMPLIDQMGQWVASPGRYLLTARSGRGHAQPFAYQRKFYEASPMSHIGQPNHSGRVRGRRLSGRLGVVRSLAHPGGNVTGFLAFEYSFNTKLLKLLKKIALPLSRSRRRTMPS
jgi:hypothetical protein